MRYQIATLAVALTLCATTVARADGGNENDEGHRRSESSVQLGPRPFFLVNEMEDGRLKRQLQKCTAGPFRKSDFSIGHRGAALQFPEHTRESYEAGARMGAGILECDVTFTKDKQLVCRHAQNDLHTTTNILVTPLASKCIKPFTPAVLGPNGQVVTPASAECRTSELTLAEFKTLTGKMDAFNPAAQTPAEYLGGTPDFRTTLQAGPTSGHLLTFKESIELMKQLGTKMTPELKAPSVTMPFDGFTQEMYAQTLIDELKAAGVRPRDAFVQSFSLADVLYWVTHEPAFGRQAVFLDDANVVAELPTFSDLVSYRQQGVRIWAPPTFALLALDGSNRIVASQAARDAKEAGLDIITWTLERSGILADGNNGFYYQTIDQAIKRDGDLYKVLDVLAKDVGILGVFSDWAAPVTFYANCMGL
jgi:glycerophosphoryl diester phosphodiesterase